MAFRLCTRNRLGLLLTASAASTIALLTTTKARAAEYVVYERDREPVTATSALALGFDVEGAVPTSTPRFLSGNNLSGGSGFKLRIGDQIHMPRLRVTPEGGYAFDHLFATDDTGAAYDWNMHRFFGGIRVAFGRVVVPGFYGHLGYGWRDTGDPTVPQSGASRSTRASRSIYMSSRTSASARRPSTQASTPSRTRRSGSRWACTRISCCRSNRFPGGRGGSSPRPTDLSMVET